MALQTEVEELKSHKDNIYHGTITLSDHSKFGKLLAQKKTNIGDKTFKDGYQWLWCPKYASSNFNSLHARHKPEDYDSSIACHSKFKKDKIKSQHTPAPKLDRKLILSKEMKAALLAVGVFVEEQTDEITKITQAKLLKDF